MLSSFLQLNVTIFFLLCYVWLVDRSATKDYNIRKSRKHKKCNLKEALWKKEKYGLIISDGWLLC